MTIGKIPASFRGLLGVASFSLVFALISSISGIEPYAWTLLIAFLAASLANVLANAFMRDDGLLVPVLTFVLSVFIIWLVIYMAPARGQIGYPGAGSDVETQRIYVGGTIAGLSSKYSTVCVVTPYDPSGSRHPCYSTTVTGQFFRTDSQIWVGRPKELAPYPYLIELRATERKYRPEGEEMKDNEQGTFIHSVTINRK